MFMKTIILKQPLRALLLAVIAAIALPANAYDFLVDGIAYNINEDGSSVSVTQNVQNYPTYSGDIVIPESVENNGQIYAVIAIGERAFDACRELTSISLPNSLEQIGKSSFSRCSGLTEIAIPNCVHNICSSAFESCTSLASIELPDSLTDLNNYVFMSCISLSSIKLPEQLKNIYMCAFDGCSSLTEIVIPNSVENIHSYAFRDCSNLEKITMGESLKFISRDAFTSSCRKLKTVIWNVVNCEEFGDAADNPFYLLNFFNNCITNFEFGEKVTTIPNFICRQFRNLESIAIPNSTISIGKEAFAVCTGLTSISIPNSVNTISEYAFAGCENLTAVFSSIKDPQLMTCDVNTFNLVNTSTCTLFVPKGTLSDYQNTAPWSDFLNIVEVDPADINLDGHINAADITTLYNYLLDGDLQFMGAYDVNGDGFINAADITTIYDILLGNQ
jgi:hypothetical protein